MRVSCCPRPLRRRAPDRAASPHVHERSVPATSFHSHAAKPLYALWRPEPRDRVGLACRGEEGIRDEVSAAGFGTISLDAVDARSRAASPRDAALAYCQGTPLRNEIDARGAPRLEDATTHAAEALARRFGSGAVEGRIRALVITAMR